MDVRAEPAFWVDYSRPGEAPRYGEGGVDPDEGAADVGDDNPLVGKLVEEDSEPAKASAKATPPSAAKSAPATGEAPGPSAAAATPTDDRGTAEGSSN
jgi:hypothetical protein